MKTNKDVDVRPQETVIRRLFALMSVLDAQGNRDLDTLCALFSDDMSYVIPFSPTGTEVRCTGKAEFCSFFGKLQGAFADIKYTLAAIHVDERRDIVTVEGETTRLIRKTGKNYENRFCLVFGFEDGLINMFHEYVNPIAAMKVTEAVDVSS